MQALNSKNYGYVVVTLRDSTVITMNASSGLRLMQYLTTDKDSSHVQITDDKGAPTVVKITDILRVEPVEKMKELTDYV